MLKVKDSMIYLQCITFSETCSRKNAEAAENGHIFHFVSVFPSTPELHKQHTKPLQSWPESAACVCAILSILACIIVEVATIHKIL
jgi:hypothetical protein